MYASLMFKEALSLHELKVVNEMLKVRCKWYYFLVLAILVLAGILGNHFYPQMTEGTDTFVGRHKNTLLSFISKEPELDYILIEKNREECRLHNGESIHLSSGDTFIIKDTITNLFFNRGIKTDIEGIGTDDDTNCEFGTIELVDMMMTDITEGRKPSVSINVSRNGRVFATSFLDVGITKDDWTAKAEVVKKLTDKIRYLKKAVESDPSDTSVRVDLADAYIRKGDLAESIAALEEVVKTRPTDKDVYEKLIYLYKKTNNSDGMIRMYNSLIKLYPEDDILRYNLGILLEDREEYKSAISEFLKAAKLNPGDAGTHVHLAYNYTKIGRLKKAISEYERAEKLNKKDPVIPLNLAILYEKEGKLRKAIEKYEKARKLTPDDMDILTSLAGIYMDIKDHKKAIPLYKKVTRSSSKDSVIWGKLGYAYSEERMWRKAVAAYKKSVRYGSDDAITHLNLAILFEKLDDTEKALNEYKKALERDPSLREAKEKIPKLSIEILRRK